MNPGPLYEHLAGPGCEEQEALISLVVEQCAPEKIFLLGGALLHRRTESLFTTAPATVTRTGHIYLLVLVQKEGEHSLACLQDRLEKAARSLLPLTVLPMGAAAFNDWLASGHPGAVRIREKAALLYDAGNLPFSPPGAADAEALKSERESLFCGARTRVTEFLAGAELFSLRVRYGMAAFMLHQAAEQALRAMLIIRTGLRVNTHSIEKLLRYCSLFCHPLPDLFPESSEKEKALFSLLQRAYIGARYGDDYAIKAKELCRLTEKVRRIQALFESYAS